MEYTGDMNRRSTEGGVMTVLNQAAYSKLIEEDLEWLMKQPRSLERDHIALILTKEKKYKIKVIDELPSRHPNPRPMFYDPLAHE